MKEFGVSSAAENPSGASPPPRPRASAKDGLWVLGAKVYFILTGLVQQVVLGRLLGLDGYGALATALGVSSIAHNTIVQASLQGVSRVMTRATGDPARTLRHALAFHAKVAVGLGAFFFIGAGVGASLLGAAHVASSIRVLSIVFLFYGVYAPFVGALNGTGRIRGQALFDILSATLRTLGMLGGALLGAKFLGHREGPLGAVIGFAIAAGAVLVVSAMTVGWGERGASEWSGRSYARELGSLVGGQLVLNLLFQADALLLRRVAATLALEAGQAAQEADHYVGAYRAAQLFAFLPYQLLASVTIVLFPLVARAQAESDPKRITAYVQNGFRIVLIVLGLAVSIYITIPRELIGLVYGPEARELGGPTLRVLGPSLSLLALLGVLTTCLNSLGHAKKTFLVTLGALLSVVALSFLGTRGAELGLGLLQRVALGTGAGLLIAVLLTARELIAETGAIIRARTLVNVIGATLAALAAGTWLFGPAVPVVPRTLLIAAVHVGLLLITRELGLADLKSLAGQRPKP